MIEFLGIPYQQIAIAGIFPAFLYFFGMFMQVHFEAKREGLRGLTNEEMPKLRESFKKRWPTLIPLILLIGVLASGRIAVPGGLRRHHGPHHRGPAQSVPAPACATCTRPSRPAPSTRWRWMPRRARWAS